MVRALDLARLQAEPLPQVSLPQSFCDGKLLAVLGHANGGGKARGGREREARKAGLPLPALEERGLGATPLERHLQLFDFQTRRLEAAANALF